MKLLKVPVLSNERVLSSQGADCFLMRIKVPEITEEVRPGQFLMLKCSNDTMLRRPISIHDSTSSGEVYLLYAVKDDSYWKNAVAKKGTRWLAGLKKGSELDVMGPLGNGFAIQPKARNILLVSGGIGVAPLKLLAKSALSAGKKVTLLLGAREAAGAYPSKLLPAGLKSVYATEDGSLGRKSNVVDVIPDYIDWADQVFACGPQAMLEAISTKMKSWPVEKPVQVSLEVRMGCGTGICYSCSIKTLQGMKKVCKEGPVFNIKDIIWQEVKI